VLLELIEPLELIDDMDELAVDADAGGVLCWPAAEVSWANAGTANAAAINAGSINAGSINLRMGTVPREVRCWCLRRPRQRAANDPRCLPTAT